MAPLTALRPARITHYPQRQRRRRARPGAAPRGDLQGLGERLIERHSDAHLKPAADGAPPSPLPGRPRERDADAAGDAQARVVHDRRMMVLAIGLAPRAAETSRVGPVHLRVLAEPAGVTLGAITIRGAAACARPRAATVGERSA